MNSFVTSRLDDFIADDEILLGRGDVISKDDIKAYPGAYPIYSSSAHNNGKFGEYAKFMFDEELITWSVDGGGNFFYRPKHKYSVTNVCGYMRLKGDKLHPKFVYYSLVHQHQSLTFDYTSKAHPSVIKKQYWLPLIPKTRQQKIASILTSIDTAIEKTEALIEKYQQIKAGLMHDLFTRGVLPNGQLRPSREQAPELYQETPIGWIPKDWQYELLDQLVLRGSGHTPNKNISDYWNGGVKWVSLADSYRLDQLYISDTDLEISQKGIQNSSAVLHPAGIVVLSRDAGVGKSAITTEPMAVSQHFMCWKCDQKMNNHFLYYWLQHNKRVFENIAMGSTILTIGLPYFKRLKIACPVDVKEQNAIAEKLRTIDSSLFALQNDLVKKRQQKLGLMQDLLTGKVEVCVSDGKNG
jgi:type I restriction enzyme S subunit